MLDLYYLWWLIVVAIVFYIMAWNIETFWKKLILGVLYGICMYLGILVLGYSSVGEIWLQYQLYFGLVITLTIVIVTTHRMGRNTTNIKHSLNKEDEIKSIAYRIWLGRGKPVGQDIDIWNEAEVIYKSRKD